MSRSYSITAAAIAAERERVAAELVRVRQDEDLARFNIANVIKLDELELKPVGPHNVRLKILAVSAEHNVDHAALADTVNIAELRGGKIYPGNSAVGEVIEVSSEVKKFQVGDVVITHCNGGPDIYGYPTRIFAYDADDSIGWYGEEAVVGDWQIIKAPLDCGLDLWQIAALPLRAPTAYHLWRRALGIFRLKVSAEQRVRLNVLAFGGGVSELFLMLAASQGHNTYFCSGTTERLTALETQISSTSIDQREFRRFQDKDDVKAFSKVVKQVTGGEGMHLVCDMLRGPVFPAGITAMAREGVNVSAGWQLGKGISYDSAGLSVKQVTLDHTHYDTIDGCHAATELYGTVFKPTVHSEIYPFEDLPRCMDDMYRNVQTGIPIVRVAKDMPATVHHLTLGMCS